MLQQYHSHKFEAIFMSQQRTSVVGGMGLWQLEAGGGAELVTELDDLLYNDAGKCHRVHLQGFPRDIQLTLTKG